MREDAHQQWTIKHDYTRESEFKDQNRDFGVKHLNIFGIIIWVLCMIENRN